MWTTNLFIGAAVMTASLAVPHDETLAINARLSKFKFTGVSEAGAEFGNAAIPGRLGKDYAWPNNTAIDTLIGTGMNIFRIPILMERIIPSNLTGTINETYASGLDGAVSHTTGRGAYAVVDPHNFGRYYGSIITEVAGFEAFWKTVARRYANNTHVIFDTNNEYHDMDESLVVQLNQAAINGIRAAGATSQTIFVEGNSWSGAWTWTTTSGNGPAMGALTDPQNNIVYEMHQYLDTYSSGTSAVCINTTIGRDRLTAATTWLKANDKVGILGETAGGANPTCITAIQGMLQYMEDNSDVWVGWIWWGAGPWWGDYMYGMEPPSGAAYTGVLPSIRQYI